jgi:hypothetical protein
MRLRLPGRLAPLCLLLIAGGCGSSAPTYQSIYPYMPQPAMVTIFSTKDQKPAVDAIVSLMGVHQPDQSAPLSMEVRMRLENKGVVAATFDPRSMSLESGALQSFDPPLVHLSQPLQIAPGQAGALTVFFPFPRGSDSRSMGLDTLRLRWEVQLDQETISQTALFKRTSGRSYEVH